MLTYLPVEIAGVLASGWTLGGDGAFDAKKRVFKARLCDPTDTEWDFEVTAERVERLGRIGALREAVERVVRESLG